MDITTEIGNRIRIQRQKKHLSQEKLAEYSDLHHTYIGQLERGEKTPSIDTLYKIAKGLGIPLTALLQDLETVTEAPTDYALKSYQLIERQTPGNQEHLYYILERIMKMKL